LECIYLLYIFITAAKIAHTKNYNFAVTNFSSPIMLTIYKAAVTDALLITQLAREIYKEHYLHLWQPGGAQWYMQEYAYAQNKIEQELADTNVEYFIAAEDGASLGYMKILLNATLTNHEMPDALEVERIYVHKAATGKGLGKKLMDVAQQKAKALNKHIIFLKAMDSSTAAIAFYKKLGYEICGSLQLPLPDFLLIKEGCRGMVILKKSLTA
jgi:diamine N-acetyltransferase